MAMERSAAQSRQATLADVARVAGVSVGTASNYFRWPDRLAPATYAAVAAAIQQLGYVPGENRGRSHRGLTPDVGITEVATAAGVSVGTVSNYLNRPEILAPATLERVQSAIDELGYIPNVAARNLRVGHSRSIGLLVLDIGNPFFTDFVKGAERAAGENGYAVVLGDAEEDPEREAAYLNLFLEQRVAGVIVSPIGAIRQQIEELKSRGTHAVLVDEASASRDNCSVSVNDLVGGRLAMTHLLELGHRDIAFVTGPQRIRQVRARREGAEAATRLVSDARMHVVETDAFSGDAGRAAGEQILERGSSRPTAVFAANDLLALGVMQAMFAAGVSIPEQMSLVGYDDISYAANAAVPLTSVRQPSREMGAEAARMLIDEVSSPETHRHEHVQFEPTLIVRSSTRPR